MALTITPKPDKPGRSAKRPSFGMAQKATVEYLFTVTGDSSYPNTGAQNTRGYALDKTVQLSPGDMLRVVESIVFDPYIAQGAANDLAAGHLAQCVWDPTNSRIRIFDNGTEVANTTNISGVSFLGHGIGYA